MITRRSFFNCLGALAGLFGFSNAAKTDGWKRLKSFDPSSYSRERFLVAIRSGAPVRKPKPVPFIENGIVYIPQVTGVTKWEHSRHPEYKDKNGFRITEIVGEMTFTADAKVIYPYDAAMALITEEYGMDLVTSGWVFSLGVGQFIKERNTFDIRHTYCRQEERDAYLASLKMAAAKSELIA